MNALIDLGINPWQESNVSAQVHRDSPFNLPTKEKEGGLPLHLIDTLYRLKKEHKILFWFQIRGIDVIIRPMVRRESRIYNQYISQHGDSIDKWPLIKQCLLFPSGGFRDLSYYKLFGPKALAGWATVIENHILSVSAFDKSEELQIIKEAYVGGLQGGEFDLTTEWMLRGNLSGLTKEAIDDMTAIEIMESVAAISHLTKGETDFNLINSEEDQQKLEARALDNALERATPDPSNSLR